MPTIHLQTRAPQLSMDHFWFLCSQAVYRLHHGAAGEQGRAVSALEEGSRRVPWPAGSQQQQQPLRYTLIGQESPGTPVQPPVW